MLEAFVTPWGIAHFDAEIGGIPACAFNIVETENNQIGLLALGHFLVEGLSNGEKCAIVTFENPLSFLESFETLNFDFFTYLKAEQFIFLSYQPNISQEMGLSQNYESFLEEVRRLSMEGVQRVAFHQLDTLLNLQSPMMINSCCLKLMSAAKDSATTYLGQYVNFGDPTYNSVRIACLKYMTGYFSIHATGENLLRLRVERIPSFHVIEKSISLRFQPGRGLVAPDGAPLGTAA
jgi:KaiC/GvpD/RAD55 family RecA-like ATPase